MRRTHTQTQMALGSDVVLCVVASKDVGQVSNLFREMWQSVFRFEKQFSRFLPGSELSTFNRSAGIKQRISPEFREILLTTKDYMKKTKGLFNPFILPALQKSGYSQSKLSGHENDVIDDFSDRSITSINNLTIGDTWASIPYGTAIDLGGIGKGYLAEQLRRQTPKWVDGLWYSIGGDIVLSGVDEDNKFWKVAVQNEVEQTIDRHIEVHDKQSYGIATSGITKRQGTHNGENWHHIIDPSSGKPAQTNIESVTVVHESALSADILASCIVILGIELSINFMKEHDVLGAIIRHNDEYGIINTDTFTFDNDKHVKFTK